MGSVKLSVFPVPVPVRVTMCVSVGRNGQEHYLHTCTPKHVFAIIDRLETGFLDRK